MGIVQIKKAILPLDQREEALVSNQFLWQKDTFGDKQQFRSDQEFILRSLFPVAVVIVDTEEDSDFIRR